eukprot:m.579189 g.579189  ORF g.579189 m.579189 type:complete len:120 (-) comp22314_c1_seq1:1438-1797(-)
MNELKIHTENVLLMLCGDSFKNAVPSNITEGPNSHRLLNDSSGGTMIFFLLFDPFRLGREYVHISCMPVVSLPAKRYSPEYLERHVSGALFGDLYTVVSTSCMCAGNSFQTTMCATEIP